MFTRATVWDGGVINVTCNCRPRSAMDDSVEGPSATIKQKIEDRGSLRKWSGVAIIVYE